MIIEKERIDNMKFHIGDVVSVTTGKLLSPRKMEGIYEILDFLTGDSLYTHELPFASKFTKPYLLSQHPELSEINKDEINTENYKEKLDALVAEYGEYLEITNISDEWNSRNKTEDDTVLVIENDELVLKTHN